MPPVGAGGIDTEDLDVSEQTLGELLDVDPEAWSLQMPQFKEHYAEFGDKLAAGNLRPVAKRLRDSA